MFTTSILSFFFASRRSSTETSSSADPDLDCTSPVPQVPFPVQLIEIDTSDRPELADRIKSIQTDIDKIYLAACYLIGRTSLLVQLPSSQKNINWPTLSESAVALWKSSEGLSSRITKIEKNYLNEGEHLLLPSGLVPIKECLKCDRIAMLVLEYRASCSQKTDPWSFAWNSYGWRDDPQSTQHLWRASTPHVAPIPCAEGILSSSEHEIRVNHYHWEGGVDYQANGREFQTSLGDALSCIYQIGSSKKNMKQSLMRVTSDLFTKMLVRPYFVRSVFEDSSDDEDDSSLF